MNEEVLFYINYTIMEYSSTTRFYQMGPYKRRELAMRHMDELRGNNTHATNIYLTHDRKSYRELVGPLTHNGRT